MLTLLIRYKMAKVMKIFLNQGFTPIDQKVFKRGTYLNFDCYIKRFNGFVILIESGTFLDESTYKKITDNKLQVYVEMKNHNKYKNYALENSSDIDMSSSMQMFDFDAEVERCRLLQATLLEIENTNEKLKTIYINGKKILDVWIFKNKEKKIPFDALESLADNLIAIVNKERITLSNFNNFLDRECSLSAHLIKVAFFASIIGAQIKIDLLEQRKLLLVALMYDMGKCLLDEKLLNKQDRLSEVEFKMIQTHADASVQLVRKSGFKDRVVLNAIREHHERLDGSGYPGCLVDNRISQFGKIVAVCDVFDALITEKPYRKAYTTFDALRLIRSEYKNKLDMGYVNILIKHLK